MAYPHPLGAPDEHFMPWCVERDDKNFTSGERARDDEGHAVLWCGRGGRALCVLVVDDAAPTRCVDARRAGLGGKRTPNDRSRVGSGAVRLGAGRPPLLLGRHGAGMLRLFRTRAARVAFGRHTPSADGGRDCLRAHPGSVGGGARWRHPVVAGSRWHLRRQRLDGRCARHASWRGAPSCRRSPSRIPALESSQLS
jgi:hypothetical protein